MRHLFSRLTIAKVRPKPKGYPLELKTVGNHIRRKRMDEGLSLNDVGDIIGVSDETLTSWALHNRKPMIAQYPGIIRFLGYDPLDTGGNSIKERLGRYKRAKGYSNKALSKMIGCDEATITRLFENKRLFNRSFDKIDKFLREVSF